jgi:predicted alpha/beta-hydrolase family hydrolase
MKKNKVTIALNTDESVSGVLSLPDTGVILAHGAGNDMESPLLVYLSTGLAQRGYFIVQVILDFLKPGISFVDKTT